MPDELFFWPFILEENLQCFATNTFCLFLLYAQHIISTLKNNTKNKLEQHTLPVINYLKGAKGLKKRN